MMLYSAFVVSFVALGEAYPLRNHQVALGVLKESPRKRPGKIPNFDKIVNEEDPNPLWHHAPGTKKENLLVDDQLDIDFTPPIKGFVWLDFDGTITVGHMWEILKDDQNPWSSSPAAPEDNAASGQVKGVTSELGQFARLRELGPGFSKSAVGGPDRIDELEALLKDLEERNIAVIVVSKGNVAVIRQILHDTGLLPYIAKTYGFKEWQNGAYKKDQEASEKNSELQADDFMQYRGGYKYLQDETVVSGKKDIIKYFMEHKKLNKNRIIFVDDDPREREGVRELLPQENIIQVPVENMKKGMTPGNMQKIREIVQGWN